MKNVLLSVLLRSHNEIGSVKSTINNLRRQDFKNLEVIAVDNMSTDGTYEYLKSICDQVIQIRNFSHALSCNIGIKKCRGKYIYITNAHCLLLNSSGLRIATECLERKKKIAGCYGRCIPTPTIANNVEKVIYLYDLLTQPTKFKLHDKYVPGAMQTTCALFRASLLKQNPFQEYSLKGGEDGLWAHQITKMGYLVAFVPEMSVYHAHGGSNLDTIKRYVGFASMALGYDAY